MKHTIGENMKNKFKLITLLRLSIKWLLGRENYYMFGNYIGCLKFRKYYKFNDFLWRQKNKLLEQNLGKDLFENMVIKNIWGAKV
jgi:hypothetical protein